MIINLPSPSHPIVTFPWFRVLMITHRVTFSMGHAGASRESPNDQYWKTLSHIHSVSQFPHHFWQLSRAPVGYRHPSWQLFYQGDTRETNLILTCATRVPIIIFSEPPGMRQERLGVRWEAWAHNRNPNWLRIEWDPSIFHQGLCPLSYPTIPQCSTHWAIPLSHSALPTELSHYPIVL